MRGLTYFAFLYQLHAAFTANVSSEIRSGMDNRCSDFFRHYNSVYPVVVISLLVSDGTMCHSGSVIEVHSNRI